jgi:hypothetical protein
MKRIFVFNGSLSFSSSFSKTEAESKDKDDGWRVDPRCEIKLEPSHVGSHGGRGREMRLAIKQERRHIA